MLRPRSVEAFIRIFGYLAPWKLRTHLTAGTRLARVGRLRTLGSIITGLQRNISGNDMATVRTISPTGPGRPGPLIRPTRAANRAGRAGPARASVPPALSGRGPGCSLRVTGAGCCGPARRRGLAELADDVVVVAVAEDACLVRLTIDDVIDLGGQVFIRLGGPAPVPLP